MGNKSSQLGSQKEREIQQILSHTSELKPTYFRFGSLGHHGLPSEAKVLTYSAAYQLLAVGTMNGMIKIYGARGMEQTLQDRTENMAQKTSPYIVHLEFTPTCRLISISMQNEIRIWNLSSSLSSTNQKSYLEHTIPPSWSRGSSIIAIEVCQYWPSDYFYCATEDGKIHVLNEIKGLPSDYVLAREDFHHVIDADFVTTLAINPQDDKQLLVGYEQSGIFLYELTKRKVLRKYVVPTSDKNSSSTFNLTCMAWHGSGKRFISGYENGSIVCFRADKFTGAVFHFMSLPIQKIIWSTKYQHQQQGAGRLFIQTSPMLSCCSPPSLGTEYTEEEKLNLLNKSNSGSQSFPWDIQQIHTANESDCIDFEICEERLAKQNLANDHEKKAEGENEDHDVRLAMNCVVVLSGNGMDGVVPGIWIYPMNSDKKDISSGIPLLKYLSPKGPICTIFVADVDHLTNQSIIDDFKQLQQRAVKKSNTGNDAKSANSSWPLNGGTFHNQLKSAVPLSTGSPVGRKSSLIVTAHENGTIVFWESILESTPTTETRAAGGQLMPIYSMDLREHLLAADLDVCALRFCVSSRILAIGMKSGQITLFRFGHWYSNHLSTPSAEVAEASSTIENVPSPDVDGFTLMFSLHMHACDITHLYLSTAYDCLAVADSLGVVSLIKLSTANYQFLIFDVSLDQNKSITSILINEMMQEIIISMPIPNTPGSPTSSGKVSTTSSKTSVTLPVVFIGRGDACIEVYDLSSGQVITKIMPQLSRDHSLPLSSRASHLTLLNADRREVRISGQIWESSQSKQENNLNKEPVAGTDDAHEEPKGVLNPQELIYETMKEVMDEIPPPLPTKEEAEKASIISTMERISLEACYSTDVDIPPGCSIQHFEVYREISGYLVVKDFRMIRGQHQPFSEDEEPACWNGWIISAINQVNVLPLTFIELDCVFQKLTCHPKTISFTNVRSCYPQMFPINKEEMDHFDFIQGFQKEKDERDTEDHRPRFLLCCFGRQIMALPLVLPQASDLARGKIAIQTRPIAHQSTFAAEVVSMKLVEIPIEDRVNTCLVCADALGQVYVLEPLTLALIWRADFHSSARFSSDFTHVDMTTSGSLILTTSAHEVCQYSIFHPDVQLEALMLEYHTCDLTWIDNTVLDILPGSPTSAASSPKSSSSLLDPNKSKHKQSAAMLIKKMVTSIGQHKPEPGLDDVFSISSEQRTRDALFGHIQVPPTSETTKTISTAVSTRDHLERTSQNLAIRGEKLNDLAEKTNQMKDASEDFYQTLKKFNDRESKKKWYQL